jgi:hypothetical protein
MLSIKPPVAPYDTILLEDPVVTGDIYSIEFNTTNTVYI